MPKQLLLKGAQCYAALGSRHRGHMQAHRILLCFLPVFGELLSAQLAIRKAHGCPMPVWYPMLEEGCSGGMCSAQTSGFPLMGYP